MMTSFAYANDDTALAASTAPKIRKSPRIAARSPSASALPSRDHRHAVTEISAVVSVAETMLIHILGGMSPCCHARKSTNMPSRGSENRTEDIDAYTV